MIGVLHIFLGFSYLSSIPHTSADIDQTYAHDLEEKNCTE